MNKIPSLYNDRMLDILENVLEELHDGVTITDRKGQILRVGESCDKLYGIGRDYQGRSVSDLEKEGIFSPSLTLIALRERRKVAMMQPDRYGHELLVTASPIFDPVSGDILYVVSYASWDSSNLSEYLHSISPRKDEPLCRIGCESFSSEILDNELFGYTTVNP